MRQLLKVAAQVVAASASLAAAQTPEELRALLDQGKAEEAYQLGRKAPERLGDPAFDFPFGVAAINAGRAAEGVLALERFVVAFPDHDGARVELARGYYLLGDDARAKEEFQAAMARKPPPEIARVIEEYLGAIRTREAKYRPTAMAYFELGGGYDSNPRAGVDNPVISLPTLGEVTVTDTGVRVGDRTLQYGAGFRATVPVSARSQLFASGQAEVARYPDVSEFDQNVYAGALGLQSQRGRFGYRLGASTSYQTLDRAPYLRTHGFFGDGSWGVNERNAVSLGLQGGKFTYAGANAVRDSDFATLAAGWKHLFGGSWRPEVELSANVGREKNTTDDRQDLSRDLYGVRIGAACAPRFGWLLAVSVVHQRSDYDEPDPILLTTREDRYSAGELSLAWSVFGALQLRAELSTAKNDSNLALYEYRRRTGLVRARYEFR